MDLSAVAKVAGEAVKLDQAGLSEKAAEKFVEASGLLLGVIKREGDARKRSLLGVRMESYMTRAEQLKTTAAMSSLAVSRQPPQAPSSARARESTVDSYFRADAAFRADVDRARGALAKVELTKQFTDAEFPPGKRALQGAHPDSRAVAWASKRGVARWVRVNELLGKRDWVIFGDQGPEAKDVDQGELGDCWLLSAVAVLTAYPELVKRIVLNSSSKAGCYAFRLCKGGQWRVVYIDDALPVRADSSPAFARPHNGRLWVALLEKAIAKLFGSYAALEAGCAAEALGVLTGLPTEVYEKKQDVLFFFPKLVAAYNAGFLISASCGGTDRTDFTRMGLISAHEYSILKVVQVKHLRLVQLRNPWARGEWKGAWSRRSKEWLTLDAPTRARFSDDGNVAKNDGVFWMELGDFAEFFSECTVCRLRRNFSQRRIDVPSPAKLDAPTTGFLLRTTASATLDACLMQTTERGTHPRGHHVSGDTMLILFECDDDRGQPLKLVGLSENRGSLSSVACLETCTLQAKKTYLLLPIVFNWRALGLQKKMTAVLYTSHDLAGGEPSAVTLGVRETANAIRAAVLARGSRRTAADAKASIFELEGIHLVENLDVRDYLTVSVALGKSTSLVSSRHGGVMGDGAYTVEDTIPPRTWQIISVRSAYRPSWSIDVTNLKWLHDPRATEQRHSPPLLPFPSIHSAYPLV